MPNSPVFDDVKPWPKPEGPADRLHNKPPLEEIVPLEFREQLLSDEPDFLLVLDNLIGAAARARANDDAELGKCGDLVNRYRRAASHIEATHKQVKQPYLEGGRLVDAESRALLSRVQAARSQVEAAANAYVARKDAEARAERDRIAAEQRAAAEKSARAEREREAAERASASAMEQVASEEERAAAQELADRKAREAQEAQSAAALAPSIAERPDPVRSDEGAVVSGKREWKSEVTDYTVAFMHVEDMPKVREAIDKAIAGLVRAGKHELDGVRIWPVAKASFR